MLGSDAPGHLLVAGTGTAGSFPAPRRGSPRARGQAFRKADVFSVKIHPQAGVRGAKIEAWKRELERLCFGV